jgi:O-antigen ligase
MKINIAAIALAVLLIPTNFAAIRQQFLPDFIAPSMLFGAIILIAIAARKACGSEIEIIVPSKLVIQFFLLNAWMILALLYSESFEFGLAKVIEYSTITMLACFVSVYVFGDPDGVKSFLSMIVLIGVLLAGLCIGGVITFFRPGADEQVIGQNYLAIQHIAGLAAIITLYYFMPRSHGRLKVSVWLSMLMLLMSALLITGGKGPVLSFVLTTIAMAALSFRHVGLFNIKPKRRAFLYYPLVIFALGAILLTSIVFIFEESAFLHRPDFLLTEGNYNLAERTENIGVAVDLFVDNPLLGAGTGSFAAHAVDIEEAEDKMKYPHNILLEVLAELGIIGFILLGFLLCSSYGYFRTLHHKYDNSEAPVALLACFIFTFLNSLTSQYIANPALFAFIGAPYGLARSLDQEDL